MTIENFKCEFSNSRNIHAIYNSDLSKPGSDLDDQVLGIEQGVQFKRSASLRQHIHRKQRNARYSVTKDSMYVLSRRYPIGLDHLYYSKTTRN